MRSVSPERTGDDMSICHVLFHCSEAQETWSLSGLPLPPAGFSRSSIFLNLHYLLSCSKKQSVPAPVRSCFPWILWQLWKARNALTFERIRYDADAILAKAKENAMEWSLSNLSEDDEQAAPATQAPPVTSLQGSWKKPSLHNLKCNVSAGRDACSGEVGVAWIIRDHHGAPIIHGRRSYTSVQSVEEAELLGFLWAIESLHSLHFTGMIFESDMLHAREALLWPLLFPRCKDIMGRISMLLQTFFMWSGRVWKQSSKINR